MRKGGRYLKDPKTGAVRPIDRLGPAAAAVAKARAEQETSKAAPRSAAEVAERAAKKDAKP